MLGFCCKAVGALVLLAGVVGGLLASGWVSKNTNFFVWLDQQEFNGGKYFMGLIPQTHRDAPFGYTFEELAANDLTGQNILVTGANAGLGYWSAYHLAKSNANVVLGCRSAGKCKAAADKIKSETGKAVETVIVDLGSFKSIRAASSALKKKYKSFDSLMLNAGVMAPPFSMTEDGLEMMMGVNHFGHFLLTQELLPLVEAAAKKNGVATICVVSSAANFDSHKVGILPTIADMNDESKYDRAGSYGQSKLANVFFAQELAERLADKNILVNVIHPGGVDTELARHIVELIGSVAGEGVSGQVQNLLSAAMWHPSTAALTQIYASVGQKLKAEKISGKYFHPIARMNTPNPIARNKKMQKHLWKLTEDFIKSH